MSGVIERRRILKKIGEGIKPGHLLFNDFYNRPGEISATLSKLVSNQTLIAGSKGKLTIPLIPVGGVSPWYHVRVPTNRQCALLSEVYFRNFNFIPKRCRSCWKTVIVTNPVTVKQSVSDLFRLRDVLQVLDLPSKCGCDVRIYTPTRYAAFIYGDSLEEGKAYYNIAVDRILKEFPKGKIILKRGCTEFEHKFLDSQTWDSHPEWDALETYLEFLIEPCDESKLDALLQHTDADTFRFWVEYAYSVGDLSWKTALESQGYEVPEELFFKSITYHEEKEDAE